MYPCYLFSGESKHRVESPVLFAGIKFVVQLCSAHTIFDCPRLSVLSEKYK